MARLAARAKMAKKRWEDFVIKENIGGLTIGDLTIDTIEGILMTFINFKSQSLG
jgi:hypothetical protein